MRTMKKIILALLIIMIIPSVYASGNLTIETKTYNENTKEFVVGGSATYNEVMISLFDGETLLSFKTVTPESNSYTATFNITFDEDKTITIKVGDINSTDYEMTTLDVNKTIIPEKSNVITDGGGNKLTILDTTRKFELDDTLFVQIEGDLSNEDQNQVHAMETILGNKKILLGVMFVDVKDGNNMSSPLPDTNNGYKLFINMPESALEDVSNPYMARVLDDELSLEEGKAILFNQEEQGFVAYLNNTGTYIFYDNLDMEYPFLDDTDNQNFNPDNDETLTIRVDAAYSKFVSVYVDNNEVDSSNYTKSEGSTIITFTSAFLNSLSSGNHTIKVNFTDGQATTNFTIGSMLPLSTTNPQTYDAIIKWITLMGISLIGLLIGTIMFRKYRRQ